MKHLPLLLVFSGFISCVSQRPNIKCSDLNNVAADTTYFVYHDNYEGFIFPESHKPYLTLSDKRFTPTERHILTAEKLLAKTQSFKRLWKRQYLGSLSDRGDTLITIVLERNGFKQECFDKIVAIGFGDHYERNQRIETINLTKNERK